MDFYGRRERVVIKFEGAPSACSCKIGGRVCARMGGAGRRSSYHGIGAYDLGSHHHARGAWESIEIFAKVGSSGVQ